VPFFAAQQPIAGTRERKGCAAASAALIADLVKRPGSFYVNIATTDLPKGAIRGQLAGAGGGQLPFTGPPGQLPLAIGVGLMAGGIVLLLQSRRKVAPRPRHLGR
jgi:hypothetical protein